MVWNGRVEYDDHAVISIGVITSRRYLVVSPASVVIIIVIIVIITLSRDVFLIGLVIVWIGVGEFKLQYIKDFQSDRGSLREPPNQLANTSGERQDGPREVGDYAANVEIEELVTVLTVTVGAKHQCLKRTGLHGFPSVLVSFEVFYKLKELMIVELNGLASNYGLWSHCSGYAILDRKAIGPECYGIDELAYKNSWDADVY